jgi:hypothetical protein
MLYSFPCSLQMSLTCPMSCWTLITRWSSLFHLDLYIFFAWLFSSHKQWKLVCQTLFYFKHLYRCQLYSRWIIMLLFLLILLFHLIQGKDYRSQLQLGNGALFGASYIQVQYVRYMIVLGIKLCNLVTLIQSMLFS